MAWGGWTGSGATSPSTGATSPVNIANSPSNNQSDLRLVAISSRPAPADGKPRRERVEKPKTRRVKVKIDPQLVAKARELRDRVRYNDQRTLPLASGKYCVARDRSP